MNKINPLHLLIATVLLALLMLYITAETEKRTAAAADENLRTEQLGKRVAQMRQAWNDPKETQRRIDRLFASPLFKPYLGKTQKERNVYRTELHGVPPAVIDRLTTRLLNEPLALKQLQIARSGENVDLTVEFEL